MPPNCEESIAMQLGGGGGQEINTHKQCKKLTALTLIDRSKNKLKPQNAGQTASICMCRHIVITGST